VVVDFEVSGAGRDSASSRSPRRVASPRDRSFAVSDRVPPRCPCAMWTSSRRTPRGRGAHGSSRRLRAGRRARCDALLKAGARAAMFRLGDEVACWLGDGPRARLRAKVPVVDKTGAGDAFVAARRRNAGAEITGRSGPDSGSPQRPGRFNGMDRSPPTIATRSREHPGRDRATPPSLSVRRGIPILLF